MVPGRPPLRTNAGDYVGWKNLYVVTDEGQLDFLGNITGVGDYGAVASTAMSLDLGGFSVRVISLENLILSKRAMGRPKDLRTAQELERILERQRQEPGL